MFTGRFLFFSENKGNKDPKDNKVSSLSFKKKKRNCTCVTGSVI